MPANYVSRTPEIEKRLLEYILTGSDSTLRYWDDKLDGTTASRRDQFKEWRERYRARRSVASLYQDAKNTPYVNSSNLGVGLEQIFGERLIPTFLANTVDLEPSCEAEDEATGQTDDAAAIVLDRYLRNELSIRDKEERSHREVLTVGSVFHKWTWGSIWKQTDVPMTVFVHPMTKQPVMQPGPDGQPAPMFVDPKLPEARWPTDPMSGQKLKPEKISQVDEKLVREGPTLAICPVESIDIPVSAQDSDPNEWDTIGHNFSVSPSWFIGRDGDPFDGKLQHLDKLWKWMGVDPNNLYKRPDSQKEQVKLKEWHGKFPVGSSGKPVEVIALVATEPKLLLAWRVSPFTRRPFFNRQVWSRTNSPLGIGIPESIWALRSAVDAMLNQDIDAGNLYNHPPLLLSTLAMLEDEDYETVGAGTIWTMQGNVNDAAKFLPPPVGKRDPIAMLDWLISMTQRLWGVTDFNTGAPDASLSPNVATARGAMIVHSESNIKFGHFIKRSETVRSQELQFLHHEMFAKMLANPKQVVIEGQPVTITRVFFKPTVRMRASGDGLFTNPSIRQQVMTEALQMAPTNPYLSEPSTYQELTSEWAEAVGLKVTIRTPQEVQELQLVQQLIKTPQGKAHMAAAIEEIQAEQVMSETGGQNGNGHAPAQASQPPPMGMPQR